MATVLQVFLPALAVLGVQVALAQVFADVLPGPRGQGVGVAVTTLLMLAVGLVIGARQRAPGGLRRSPGQPLTTVAGLRAGAALEGWGEPLAVAGALGALGAVVYLAGGAAQLMPASASAAGGVGTAMLATNAVVVVGIVTISVGYLLGVNAAFGAFLASLAGFMLFAALAGTSVYAARFVSYESTTVAATAAAGFGLAAIVTGFVVAWFRRRLAFVELVLIALTVSYGLYLSAALGPTAWTKASNLPEEQILLALALFPPLGIAALLNVGGSLGFLLNGGGRFDPGFSVELKVALRYLSTLRQSILVVLGFILFLVLVLTLLWLKWVYVAVGFAGLTVLTVIGLMVRNARSWRRWVVGLVPIIAIGSVCIGVIALIMVLSIMSGFENDLKKKILGAHAHVVIKKKGDDFTEYRDVAKAVRSVRGVDTGSAFVLGDAMISTDVNLSGTLVKGVDVADADGVADLRATISKGSLDHLLYPEEIPGARPRIEFADPVSPKGQTSTGARARPIDLAGPAIRGLPTQRRVLPGIIIGRELAKTLRAYVGDTVKLVSPVSDEIGPMGPIPKLRRFRVAGIFYSGMYEYDAKFSYLEMTQAQRFFGMRKRASAVEVKVSDIDDTARVVEEIKRRLGGHPYDVEDWRMLNKELFSALLLEKLAMFIALGMIVIVASFLIIAVLVMVVLQRRKEIAVLKSLGASDASIMKIFVFLGLMLGTGGAIFGVILGVAFCLFLTHVGFELDERIFYIKRLPVVMDWYEIAFIVAAAIVISYLATIYPAMTASAQSPVEGLRND